MALLQASISAVISSFVHFAPSLGNAMFANGVSQGVMGYVKKWIVGKTALKLRVKMCTRGPSAHLSARVQGLDLVTQALVRVPIPAWELEKNVCSHKCLAGAVLWHQV